MGWPGPWRTLLYDERLRAMGNIFTGADRICKQRVWARCVCKAVVGNIRQESGYVTAWQLVPLS